MSRMTAVPLFIVGLIVLGLPASRADASPRHAHHHGVKAAHGGTLMGKASRGKASRHGASFGSASLGGASTHPAHRLTEAEAQSFQAHEQARRQEHDVASLHGGQTGREEPQGSH